MIHMYLFLYFYFFSVPLLESMKEQGWCEKIPTLLQVSDHDGREHVLNTMKTLVNSCKNNFIPSSNTLHNLRTEYIELTLEEEDDNYFSNMVTLIDGLIKDIGRKDELWYQYYYNNSREKSDCYTTI